MKATALLSATAVCIAIACTKSEQASSDSLAMAAKNQATTDSISAAEQAAPQLVASDHLKPLLATGGALLFESSLDPRLREIVVTDGQLRLVPGAKVDIKTPGQLPAGTPALEKSA